jgi:hypothetical protein
MQAPRRENSAASDEVYASAALLWLANIAVELMKGDEEDIVVGRTRESCSLGSSNALARMPVDGTARCGRKEGCCGEKI